MYRPPNAKIKEFNIELELPKNIILFTGDFIIKVIIESISNIKLVFISNSIMNEMIRN